MRPSLRVAKELTNEITLFVLCEKLEVINDCQSKKHRTAIKKIFGTYSIVEHLTSTKSMPRMTRRRSTRRARKRKKQESKEHGVDPSSQPGPSILLNSQWTWMPCNLDQREPSTGCKRAEERKMVCTTR